MTDTLPGTLRVLHENTLRAVVGFSDKALAAVEHSFAAYSGNLSVMPTPMDFDLPRQRAEIHIKGAYIEGIGQIAIKCASGFYGNPELGLPVGGGLIFTIDAHTGRPSALLLDNGYLTDLRTALAGAVAAKWLAPREIRTVGVVGTGVQARLQVQALALVRQFQQVIVWGRREASVARYVQELEATLDLQVSPEKSADKVVEQCDLVVTTTAARQALISETSLHSGMHITAIGADLPGKQEFSPACVLKADVVVCDSRKQAFISGELQHAVTQGLINAADVIELGELVLGKSFGRTSDKQITFCDLTGLGVQDTAIAAFACSEAGKLGLGGQLVL